MPHAPSTTLHPSCSSASDRSRFKISGARSWPMCNIYSFRRHARLHQASKCLKRLVGRDLARPVMPGPLHLAGARRRKIGVHAPEPWRQRSRRRPSGNPITERRKPCHGIDLSLASRFNTMSPLDQACRKTAAPSSRRAHSSRCRRADGQQVVRQLTGNGSQNGFQVDCGVNFK